LIIQLNNISVSYGKFLALDNISINIKGGAVGLLGPNGAGKTTLIKTFLGFLKSDSGNGQVFGMDIKTQRLNIRQKVGYMPEGDCYIPGMNAVSFVAYAGQLCGMPRRDAIQRAHEVLQYLGMDEERYRAVETYSAGMKQRIKLAQALIHDPELVFLDEPTTGMDPSGRQEMLDLIKDISTSKGINIMVSSHLLPDIEYACQDVVVISQGKIVVQGNIDELRNSNVKLFEVKIKGEKTIFTHALENISINWYESDDDFIKVALPEGMGTEILFKMALENGLQIRHLALTRYSLEDVFSQAVGEK